MIRAVAINAGQSVIPQQSVIAGESITPVDNGPEYLIVIAGHQSNMTGGQLTATGATITSADDPDPNIYQWSPNGGGASGDPSHALVLEQAIEPLRYPQTADNNVGPALTYAKGVLALNPGKKIVLIPAGKGGTNLSNWVSGAQLFEDFVRPAYESFKTAYPDSVLHSVILSPLENEMQLGADPAASYSQLLNVIAAYRGLTGASDAPIYMGSAVPLYAETPGHRLILLQGAKAAVSQPMVGVSGGLTGGSVSGDTWHYTNAANRTRGAWLVDQIARTAALNAAPAPQVTEISVISEQVTFTSVGAPYYDIQWRAVADAPAGAWTSTDWCPNQDNAPGQEFVVTMPGTGDRDCRIVAKAYGGDSTPSAEVNFTAPVVTIPDPTVELDFDSASVDGSNLFISVPSVGSDTTAWTPWTTGGVTGAAAAIGFETFNGHRAAIMSSSKRFRRTSYVFPAGDFSFALPIYGLSSGGNGFCVGWGQTSTNGDIALTWKSTSMALFVNATTNFRTVTISPASSTTAWHLGVWTYDRAANVARIYLNGIEQTLTRTLTQRSASPANSGGTDWNGYNTSGNGMSGTSKWGNPMHWDQVLTLDEIGALKAALQTKYGITFG